MSELKLAYGTNEERLNGSGEFDSYEDALEEAILENDSEVGDTIYISKFKDYIPRIDVDVIIEQINEDAYNQCGDSADGWPNLNKIQKEFLEKVLNNALLETLKEFCEMPHFYECYENKSFEITEEHLKKAGLII